MRRMCSVSLHDEENVLSQVHDEENVFSHTTLKVK